LGLSIAISGGITITALVIVLGIIFAISYQINTESLANTEAFEINNSLLKTSMTIKSIEALSGNNVINFQIYNNNTKKLWNYEDFDVLVTYDADIATVKTRITETLYYNTSASFTGIPTSNILRPDGIAEGGWGQQIGCTPGTSYLCINEIIQDDTDFIRTSNLRDNDFEVVNFTLSNVIDPLVDTGHVVRYTYKEEDNGASNPDLIVTLFQGVTTIATWTELGKLPITFTLGIHPLTIGEAGSITDYNDLRLGFNATCNGCPGGGSHERVSVSWAEIEIPDTLIFIPDIEPTEWAIAEIITDFFDPRIVNEGEYAQAIGELSYPIFPGGLLEITISSDNGKVDSDSIIVP
jgi:archaellum component FlaF (FlaF/FlaG flagellin family)